MSSLLGAALLVMGCKECLHLFGLMTLVSKRLLYILQILETSIFCLMTLKI